MTLVAVVAGKGAPGATTTAAALAAVAASEHRRALLLELDPAGGSLALDTQLGLDPGLMTLLAAARHGLDQPLIDAHAQELPNGVRVLLAPTAPSRAAAAVGALSAALPAVLAQRDGLVIADCGRWNGDDCIDPVLTAADQILVVLRPTAAETEHVRTRLGDLMARNPTVSVVCVGEEPYQPAEVAAALEVTLAPSLPVDTSRRAVRPIRRGRRPVAEPSTVAAFGSRAARPTHRRHICGGHGMTMVSDSVDEALVGQLRTSVAAELSRRSRDAESGTGRPLQRSDEELLARQLVNQHLDDLANESLDKGIEPLGEAAEHELTQAVLARLFQLGRLQPLLDDDRIQNIIANGCDQVFLEYADGSKVQAPPIASSDDELIETLREVGRRYGLAEREFNPSHPSLNLQLPDGSRLFAVAWVCGRPAVAIRRHRFMRATVDDLIRLGAIDQNLGAFLAAAVRARQQLIIAGATGAGKTTMLRALASEIPAHERIVTIETELELGLDRFPDVHPDAVALEAREANVEGVGAVTAAELVRMSLRMNPDRVIVGEVRGDEVIPMLNAMSQGNDGSLCTIHADSSATVFNKLGLYAMQAPERLSLEATNQLAAAAIDLVVFITKGRSGRFVSSVRQVVGAEDRQVITNELFRAGPDGRAVPAVPLPHELAADLASEGYDAERHSFEQAGSSE